MKVAKSRDRDPRRAKLHAGASDRIERPGRKDENVPPVHNDVDEAAGLAHLTRLHAKSSAMERMPAIMDDSFLPDMGRMTR
jgi:hypothetical protein